MGTNVITYADTGLLSGIKYYYQVRGTNPGGDSSFSNTASATTPFVVGVQGPAAPTNLVAIPEPKAITLTWTDVSGNETAFKIERSSDGAATTFAQIATVAENVTTYSDSSLPPQTTYHYRVRSMNATGDSPFSNTVSATTPIAASSQRPLAPTNLIAVSESKRKSFLPGRITRITKPASRSSARRMELPRRLNRLALCAQM